eukprot:473190-Prymnesium_polylepis.1
MERWTLCAAPPPPPSIKRQMTNPADLDVERLRERFGDGSERSVPSPRGASTSSRVVATVFTQPAGESASAAPTAVARTN